MTDPVTGEAHAAQVFVAVLGASNYTYAEATWTQGQADWLAAHTRLTTQARMFAPEWAGFRAFPAYSCRLGPWPRHAEVTA